MSTLSYTGELTTTVCWCGIAHAVPSDLYNHMNRQHEDGERQVGIYCPLGHSWTFAGKGIAQKEREARERAETRARAIADQLESEKRAHSATKGTLTKTRKRVGKGVCPCCNRTFANVTRHMHTQHPDFAAEVVSP